MIPETERRGQRTDRLAAILPPLFPSNGTRVRRRVSFVLFPFVTVALQQRTGSFALSFLCIPVLMVAMAIGVTRMVPEHSGKELNEIIV